MLDTPREAFVPDNLREAAYVGENLTLPGGRTMLEPRTRRNACQPPRRKLGVLI